MLKHFCHSEELCVFFGLHCGKGEKSDEEKKKMMMMMKRNEERNKKKICLGHHTRPCREAKQ
jgi:hypothetical protein